MRQNEIRSTTSNRLARVSPRTGGALARAKKSQAMWTYPDAACCETVCRIECPVDVVELRVDRPCLAPNHLSRSRVTTFNEVFPIQVRHSPTLG